MKQIVSTLKFGYPRPVTVVSMAKDCETLNTTAMARYLLQQKTLRTLTKYFAVPAARGSCCIASSSAARVPVSALLQRKQDFFTHSKIQQCKCNVRTMYTHKICINSSHFRRQYQLILLQPATSKMTLHCKPEHF